MEDKTARDELIRLWIKDSAITLKQVRDQTINNGWWRLSCEGFTAVCPTIDECLNILAIASVDKVKRVIAAIEA